MKHRTQSIGLGLALALLVFAPRPSMAAEAAFTEVASEVGLDFRHFNDATGEYHYPEIMASGGGLLDYDNDGDLDVYLPQGTALSAGPSARLEADPRAFVDRLYRNDLEILANGTREVTFVDMTNESGIRADGYGMGVATGDYNNDGWLDIYVTNYGANQMWRNNGDGTFADVTVETGTDDQRWSISAVFVDYDRDGWLDLYVTNYVDWAIASHKPCRSYTGALDYCGPLAYNPEPDRLFHNRGDGSFEVVSAASGIGVVAGRGMGVVPTDVNQDGWLDFYVANDGMANWMWVNNRDGTFSNQALIGGTAFNGEGRPEAGMGVAAGDFDGDGDEDLIVSHLSRETNTLFEHVSDGFFEDSSLITGLGLPSWEFTGFGIAWIDYNNDGWLDLAVVNGAVKRLEALARKADDYPFHQPNQLFRNLGKGRFADATAALGTAADQSEVSRGLAVGDVDNDGDPDFLITNDNGPVRLLRNDLGDRNNWLGARLLGKTGPRGMLGTWTELETSQGQSLGRQVRTGGSYGSASDERLLFGLGQGTATLLRAAWPSGRESKWALDLGSRYLTFFEPEAR
ncbi:MAG: CRTAC1 family protein [bacterium]|nr:CRTAC1 family protein [bacterium]